MTCLTVISASSSLGEGSTARFFKIAAAAKNESSSLPMLTSLRTVDRDSAKILVIDRSKIQSGLPPERRDGGRKEQGRGGGERGLAYFRSKYGVVLLLEERRKRKEKGNRATNNQYADFVSETDKLSKMPSEERKMEGKKNARGGTIRALSLAG
ncbi:hypothetical protein TMatcc_000898 [Talaromyces marneffei ATCC 18224]